MNVEIVGFIAGILGVIALMPQVMKSWKSKSTDDISIQWNILSISSQAIWITYGVMVNGISLLVMSSVNLILAVVLLVLKIKYSHKTK